MIATRHPRLGLRVPPLRDEPAHGLLARLAARHREHDPHAFARDLGLRFGRVARGHDVARVAALAALDAAGIASRSPSIDARGRTVRLGEGRVRLGDWSVDRRRFCPACLASDRARLVGTGRIPETGPYHRFWWDVGSIGTCPSHGVALLDRCRSCDAPQGWNAPLGRCGSCHRDLASRTGSRTAASPVDAYAVARLTGTPHRAVPLLDDMPLDLAMAELERLGTALARPIARSKKRMGSDEAAIARGRGFACVDAWPGGLTAALDDAVAGAASRGGPRGLIATYGWIHEQWLAHGDGPHRLRAELRSCLLDHAVANGVIAHGEGLGGGTEPTELAPSLSLTQAAGILGWGFDRTRRTVGGLGLVPRGSRRGVPARLDPAGIDALRADAGRRMDPAELHTFLGIGRSQARSLVSMGIVAGSRPCHATQGRGVGRVSRADAGAFVAALVAGAPLRRTIPSDAAALPDACRKAGVPIHVACRRLLAREVRPVGRLPGPISLAGVLVRWRDLREAAPNGGVSIEAAAETLGLHHETVRHLVRRGLIPAVRRDRGGRLDVADVMEFGRCHVNGTAAAAMLGTSPKAAARILRAAGITPLVSPPECRQILYRRESLVAAIAIAAPAADAVTVRESSTMNSVMMSDRRRGRTGRGHAKAAASRTVQGRGAGVRFARTTGRTASVR